MERIIRVMRAQGERNNPKGMKLGVMKNPTVVTVGDLELTGDFYMKAEGLKLESGDVVVVYPYSDSLYLILAKVV